MHRAITFADTAHRGVALAQLNFDLIAATVEDPFRSARLGRPRVKPQRKHRRAGSVVSTPHITDLPTGYRLGGRGLRRPGGDPVGATRRSEIIRLIGRRR
jgi:hypothetical protein